MSIEKQINAFSLDSLFYVLETCTKFTYACLWMQLKLWYMPLYSQDWITGTLVWPQMQHHKLQSIEPIATKPVHVTDTGKYEHITRLS